MNTLKTHFSLSAKGFGRLSLHLFFLIAIYSCTPSQKDSGSEPTACESDTATQWVGSWATAPQLVEPHNLPPEPGLSHNTLRQVVRVSLGGECLRVRFSNEFSPDSVTIVSANIALSQSGSAIDTTSVIPLSFGGKPGVTMQPETTVTSDAAPFSLEPRTDVAITIHFGTTSPDVTGHPGSRTTSYIAMGNQALAPQFDSVATADRWYVINGIDVKAPETAAAIAILGNSITDGRGSGTNRQNRWPDILSERLLENPGTQEVGVLNMGIGGNCVLKFCLGPAAVDRVERDVLKQAKVRWLIILEGINDIGQIKSADEASQVAEDLKSAYAHIIGKAHEANIKVYGGTIPPMGKSFYYQDYREVARQEVNKWIRSSGAFDAVIDFDKAIRDPENPELILPELHTGDFLHPNEKGYQVMGEAVDLSLFE